MAQNYKDPQNKIHVLDDVAFEYLLPAGCVRITQVEADAIINPPSTAAQLQAEFCASAQVALDKSDTTMMRCVEDGIAAPVAWITYRKALRAIASGTDTTSTVLPVQPEYPAQI